MAGKVEHKNNHHLHVYVHICMRSAFLLKHEHNCTRIKISNAIEMLLKNYVLNKKKSKAFDFKVETTCGLTNNTKCDRIIVGRSCDLSD